MLGLREKILIGFGGLLAILIAISVLGEGVLDRYSASMQRSFREDYDSVAVCQQMKESVERINSVIEAALLGKAPAAGATAELERAFDTNLQKQRVDATLAGEKQATDRLASLWDQYRGRYRDALGSNRSSEERRAIYSQTIFPLSQDVESSAQYLIDLNMQSVLSVHGKARDGRPRQFSHARPEHLRRRHGNRIRAADRAFCSRAIAIADRLGTADRSRQSRSEGPGAVAR